MNCLRRSALLLTGILVLATATTARAQPESESESQPESESEQVAKRLRAGALEKDGRYSACGVLYMEIYREAPSARDADALLYNAGVCFELAKSSGLARAAFAQLERRFPQSARARMAIVRRATLAAGAAEFAQAAQAYELYANRYAGEKDAPDALQRAITYRQALGQSKAALADIERFARVYRRKRRRESADLLFSAAVIHQSMGDEEASIRALKRYIKEVGKRGGVEHLLVAHAKIGGILWRQSCPMATGDGSCIQRRRKRGIASAPPKPGKTRLPTRCGPDSAPEIRVRPRNQVKAREARRFLKTAVALGGKLKASEFARPEAPQVVGRGRDDNEAARRNTAIQWHSMARFTLLEEKYESYLRIAFPRDLTFSPRNAKRKKDSELRFARWLEEAKKEARALNSTYAEIKNTTGAGPQWAVAAAARSGQVAQHFARQLQVAQIPSEVRTGPYASKSIDVFCGTLTSNAEPLEDAAVATFGFCQDLASKLNFLSSWSRLCERELAQLRPEDFPMAVEQRGKASAADTLLDREALLRERPMSNEISAPD